RAVVAAIVEHADQADVGIGLAFQRRDQVFARIAAADHHGAAIEPSLAGPAPHHAIESEAHAIEREQADAEIAGKPEARIHAAELGEEGERDQHEEYDRPRDGKPRALAHRIAERL